MAKLEMCYRVKNGKVEAWDFEGRYSMATFNNVYDMKKYYGSNVKITRYTKKDFILNGMEW